MWGWIVPVLSNLVPLAAVAAAAWITKQIKKPSDKDRAELLSTIANACAAYVLSLNPSAPWAELLRDVIQAISAAAGLPTRNVQAIEREAVAALIRLGRVPGAGK